MSRALFFVQQCPTCGRQIEVRVMYLGRKVVCQHCRGTFLASDAEQVTPHDSSESVLLRADELLASVEEMKRRPR